MGELEDLSEDGREILEDFAAIANIEANSGDAAFAEQAEADFIELREFVKVGALLICSLVTYGADDQDD